MNKIIDDLRKIERANDVPPKGHASLAGIAANRIEEMDAAMDGLSKSIQRMRSIVEMDGPPILMTNELDLMESRLAALRRS